MNNLEIEGFKEEIREELKESMDEKLQEVKKEIFKKVKKEVFWGLLFAATFFIIGWELAERVGIIKGFCIIVLGPLVICFMVFILCLIWDDVTNYIDPEKKKERQKKREAHRLTDMTRTPGSIMWSQLWRWWR